MRALLLALAFLAALAAADVNVTVSQAGRMTGRADAELYSTVLVSPSNVTVMYKGAVTSVLRATANSTVTIVPLNMKKGYIAVKQLNGPTTLVPVNQPDGASALSPGVPPAVSEALQAQQVTFGFSSDFGGGDFSLSKSISFGSSSDSSSSKSFSLDVSGDNSFELDLSSGD